MCLLWASEFSSPSCWRSNTSFVLVGVVARHPPGEPLPRSMVATCWCLSPWCLRHRHTSLRFFLPQLPPSSAHHAAFYFWIAEPNWPHRAPINIFAPLKIKKGFVYVYFSVPGCVGEEPLCDYCCMQWSPPPFICLYECLLSILLLRPQVHGTCFCEVQYKFWIAWVHFG